MTGGEEVEVLGTWWSPYVMRARVALNLKGVKYDLLPEILGSPSELLVTNNPVYKKIPVLLHDGKPVCESMVIVQYIDEVWSSTGPAILPADPYDRAIARFWVAYIEDKWRACTMGITLAQSEEAKAEAAKRLSAILLVLEEAFKKCSKGKGFFGGDAIGYVDIALGCSLGWLAAVGRLAGLNFLDEETTPLLFGRAERYRSNEAVRELMPATEELVEFSKVVKAYYGPRTRTLEHLQWYKTCERF